MTTEIFTILNALTTKMAEKHTESSPPTNQMVRLQKHVANSFRNISVEVVPTEKLENCHPLARERFAEELTKIVSLGRRIFYFLLSWQRLTKDQGNFGSSEEI